VASVNNASAISLTNSQATDMKRSDLMMGVNTRGILYGDEILHPAPDERREPAHPDVVAAAGHEGEMVRASGSSCGTTSPHSHLINPSANSKAEAGISNRCTKIK
jgi:NADP-dependent 3-hydroxy acid dehydrogenase YdfG